MPGQKSIQWSDRNDVRFLQAMLTVLDFQLPNEAAENIANCMGGKVTARAIKHRFHTHRKAGRAANPDADTLKSPIKVAVRVPVFNSPKPKTPAATKRKFKVEQETEDDEVVTPLSFTGDPGSPTPKRARRSIRATPKKDYTAIDDFCLSEEDNDEAGNKVSKLKMQESEDSEDGFEPGVDDYNEFGPGINIFEDEE